MNAAEITVKFGDLTQRFSGRAAFADEFAADLDIPVLSVSQIQGDVSITTLSSLHRRVTIRDLHAAVPVTDVGIEVIRGGAMSNAHTLRTVDTGVEWNPDVADGEGLTLGVLTVPHGAQCFLEHPEHGFSGIGPGTYVIGRQREQTDIIRMVAD